MRSAVRRVVAAIVGLCCAGALAGALVSADAEREASATALSPSRIAELLVDDGGVVVDAEGRPVIGRDGKPLRVAKDGRTIVDSRGRVVRDKRGRPLRVGADTRLRAAANKPAAGTRGKRGHSPAADPTGKPGARPATRPKPTPTPTAAASKPVVIGVAYQNHHSHNDMVKQVGAKQRAEDPLPQLQATVDHINATGGINGRRLEVRPEKYDMTERPPDHILNEVCASFKEGPKPVAVAHSGVRPWVLAPCLAEAEIPLVTHFPGTMPRSFVEQHGSGSPISPGALGLDRFADVYVSALRRLGFITPKTRVGLVWYGGPGYDESAERVKRRLAEAGIPLVAQKRTDLSLEPAQYVASFSGAVLDFRTKNVQRVLTIDNFGTIIGLFARNCTAQDCGWRYGFSSLNAPNWMAINAAPDDIDGSVGVGWAPLLDLAEDAGHSPGTRGTCAQIMRARGVDVGDRTPYGEYSAMGYCDDLLAIRAALTGREATGAGVRAGMAALGTAFGSGLTLRTQLGPQRHDGAASFRLMRYVRSCECFQYTGAPFGG